MAGPTSKIFRKPTTRKNLKKRIKPAEKSKLRPDQHPVTGARRRLATPRHTRWHPKDKPGTHEGDARTGRSGPRREPTADDEEIEQRHHRQGRDERREKPIVKRIEFLRIRDGQEHGESPALRNPNRRSYQPEFEMQAPNGRLPKFRGNANAPILSAAPVGSGFGPL